MKKPDFESLTKDEIINLLEDEETNELTLDYLEKINFPNGFQHYLKDSGCDFNILSVAKLKNGDLIPIYKEYWNIIDLENSIREYNSQNYKLNFFIKDIEFYDCTDAYYRQDLSDYEELYKFIQNHNEKIKFQKN